MMQSCYQNILESSAVSLSAGSQDLSCPLYRLYDRDIGRMFAAASAGTLHVDIEQSGTPQPVDRLLIPGGHNLQGMSCAIYFSDDGTAWTQVAIWTQPDGNLINQSFTSATHARWRFSIASPVIVPRLAELFLTSTYKWEKLPARPGGPFDDVFNVKTDVTSSGLDRFLIFGNSKRQRIYKVVNAAAAQQANITALNDAWAGAKPFWLYDHEGNWIFGKLVKPIGLKETGAGKSEFDFNFLEVLG